MAFPSTIASAHFSALMATREAEPGTINEANLKGLFSGTATGDYVAIDHIRDMPTFGTPSNIVKVPEYGLAQTLSVGAQSDAPDLQLTVNYVPAQWAPSATTWATTGTLEDLRRSGQSVWFQFALLTQKPASLHAVAAGLGTVPNMVLYFKGRIESIEISPARDDATTATVALSLQSDFYGPFTIDV